MFIKPYIETWKTNDLKWSVHLNYGVNIGNGPLENNYFASFIVMCSHRHNFLFGEFQRKCLIFSLCIRQLWKLIAHWMNYIWGQLHNKFIFVYFHDIDLWKYASRMRTLFSKEINKCWPIRDDSNISVMNMETTLVVVAYSALVNSETITFSTKVVFSWATRLTHYFLYLDRTNDRGEAFDFKA